ncbi:MAG TPA: hypothetical protein VE964_13830 [Myxococcales bacterium]|nr:hypothetical protein [Myxococcales bacterium]
MHKTTLHAALAAVAVVFSGAGAARAWDVQGHIFCDATGLPLGNVTVNVTGSTAAGPFAASTTTDDTGFYFIQLPESPGAFTETLDLTALGGGSSNPATPVDFVTSADASEVINDFVVTSPGCQKLGCWLTGGGTEKSTVTGTLLATHLPNQSFGGNVNPGCSPTAGSGGDWNHVDKGDKLHFHGTTIVVDRCGNVDGIPPGSRSPKTPFNFIEFHGTGTLQGIRGSKADYGTVCFSARAEDRHEPGSGPNAGALVDRYFIQVTDCAGTPLLVLEDTTQPGASDPVPISTGNLQLHVSSCP